MAINCQACEPGDPCSYHTGVGEHNEGRLRLGDHAITSVTANVPDFEMEVGLKCTKCNMRIPTAGITAHIPNELQQVVWFWVYGKFLCTDCE